MIKKQLFFYILLNILFFIVKSKLNINNKFESYALKGFSRKDVYNKVKPEIKKQKHYSSILGTQRPANITVKGLCEERITKTLNVGIKAFSGEKDHSFKTVSVKDEKDIVKVPVKIKKIFLKKQKRVMFEDEKLKENEKLIKKEKIVLILKNGLSGEQACSSLSSVEEYKVAEITEENLHLVAIESFGIFGHHEIEVRETIHTKKNKCESVIKQSGYIGCKDLCLSAVNYVLCSKQEFFIKKFN